MKLIEIFDQLSHGELVQLDVGNGDRPINPRDYARIGASVNQGLAALHKKFFLKDGEIHLALQVDQVRYVLDSLFAESNTRSQEPVKYILDTGNPFLDDIIKIEAIHDDLNDKIVPLNVLHDPNSVRTTDYRTLLFPEVTEAGLIRRVSYKKGHRRLVAADWENPERTEIDLPYSHLQALIYYIASRLLNPLGGNEQGNHEGKYYMGLYLKEIQDLTGEGLEIESDFNAQKFYRRGFV